MTTKELAIIIGGGDSYIRTRKNIVTGLAVKPEINPDAPDIILVGKGPRMRANAEKFLQQGQYVPVYMKQAKNAWSYVGEYKAVSYSREPEIIEKYGEVRRPGSVDGVLFCHQRMKKMGVICFILVGWMWKRES
ncbi:hypothetical protein AAIA72_14640 [Hahella sp. SMD15-11]|uniref:Uncharacterized protein n=1 Tax=Thermohahella caldifontis TaxID=3142973 RepID=A0AB39UVR8_9GAMM